MTDKQQEFGELEAFFDAARKATPDPDAALMARILDDALVEQAERAKVIAPARRQESVLRQLLRSIGGWPALTGLAAATIAGVWIGVNPPTSVSDQLAALMGVGSDAENSWFLDPLTEYDIAMTEG